MLRTNFSSLGPWCLLCSSLASVGCILTTGGNEGDEADATAGSDPATSDPSVTTLPNSESMTDPTLDPDSTGDDSVGETTGVPMGECTENRIVDGGFEAGTPSDAWIEASDNFGTPLCDTECTMDPGADPFAGDWYAWFGGIDTDPEIASVSQSLNIDGQSAFLSFRFQINAASGTGEDFFEVTVDDTSVFFVSDADMADYNGYTPISIDISDFADDASHTIKFNGDFLGNGLTNFFLDEVALVTCTEAGESTGGSSGGTSDGGSSSDTTAAESTTSGSGTSTGGTSGTDSGTSGTTGA